MTKEVEILTIQRTLEGSTHATTHAWVKWCPSLRVPRQFHPDEPGARYETQIETFNFDLLCPKTRKLQKAVHERYVFNLPFSNSFQCFKQIKRFLSLYVPLNKGLSTSMT